MLKKTLKFLPVAMIMAGALAPNTACNSNSKSTQSDSATAAVPTNGGEDYSDSTAPENWTRVSIKTTVGDMVLALNPEQKQQMQKKRTQCVLNVHGTKSLTAETPQTQSRHSTLIA